MLIGLDIRDFVLVDRLNAEFGPGLSVLSGETGAGKSILLDALGLALGARAAGAAPAVGAEAAMITASFDPPPGHPARAALAEADIAIAEDEPVSLRRRLGADGRSRGWVNDQPASMGLLKSIGGHLVEIQGQFDGQALMDPASHRDLLDAYADSGSALAAVASAHDQWRAAATALDAAKADAAEAAARESELRDHAEELATLDPQPGEEAELAGLRERLRSHEQLAEALGAARAALSGDSDGGAERRLATAAAALDKVAAIGGKRVAEALRALDAAAAEAAEASAALDAAEADFDADPERLEQAEERLFALRAVARKHRVAVDDLATRRAEIEEKLATLGEGGGALARLTASAAAAQQGYETAAGALSDIRNAAAARLVAAVQEELPALKLDKARFDIVIDRASEARWGREGWDQVSFAAATNPGAPAGPLDRIASGGELSRFLLALKAAGAASRSAPTLVFDEVDSGVGGATAAAVGARLSRLAESAQVLVVTHSPQVAARGAAHFVVAKTMRDGAARTSLTRLKGRDERVQEIARMLSGAEVTTQARGAAESLLIEAGAPAQAALL